MDNDKKNSEENDFFSLYYSLIYCDQIDYWIGNPSVELITGTIFFRKDEELIEELKEFKKLKPKSFNDILEELRKKTIETNILLVAPLPIDKNFFEFGDFIQNNENDILEMRIIKTSLSKSYGVLICFSSIEASQLFYLQYQGKQFNNLEPFVCFLKEVINIQLTYERTELSDQENIKFLKKKNYKKPINLAKKEEKEKRDPLAIFKFNLNENFDEKKKRSKEKKINVMLEEEEFCSNCPICFEEMQNLSKLKENKIASKLKISKNLKSNEKNESSSILGILCGHFFHWKCLKNWNDETCPLCRYHQQPPETRFCETCGSSDDLWMCLICGFIGCGLENKYDSHNVEHYEKSHHIYSIEIETKFVYDHSKQTYVHRLLQNSEDGKLMEMKKSEKEIQEKIEVIIADYNNVMSSQYESQKNYFEEEIKKVILKNTMEMKEKEKILADLQESNDRQKISLEKTKQINSEMEKNFNESKQEFECLLKKKYELDIENTNLSKKLEKFNEITKFTKENIMLKRQEEIKNLQAEIKDLETHFNIKEKFGNHLQGDDIEKSKFIITDSKKKKNKKFK